MEMRGTAVPRLQKRNPVRPVVAGRGLFEKMYYAAFVSSSAKERLAVSVSRDSLDSV